MGVRFLAISAKLGSGENRSESVDTATDGRLDQIKAVNEVATFGGDWDRL